MPSEEPPCPCCNSTDTLSIPFLFIFTSQSSHTCMSCRHCWISGPLSAGDGDGTPILNPSPPFPSPLKASALERGFSPLHQTTALPLSHFLQTSPSDTWRSALATRTPAGPDLVSYKPIDPFQAMQATAAGASGSAEIRSARNEPDGVHERRHKGSRRRRWGTFVAEFLSERKGPRAARAYGRAAYGPRDATAIRNFPNEFLLGCKAASSERQAVENAMLFPGLYFVCKACGRTFPTHQAWEVHRLSHLELTPTKPNVSVNATTMPNRVSSGEVIGLAHQDSDDIEKGRLSDHVRGRPRWAIVVDPLFDVNVQGAFTLVAFKTSNGSSAARDVLLYVLGFVYVLGFLSAVGGKLFPRFKMQLIGWVAAALGFLLTMALLLV